jgi:hypothetical protein
MSPPTESIHIYCYSIKDCVIVVGGVVILASDDGENGFSMKRTLVERQDLLSGYARADGFHTIENKNFL